MEPDHSSGPAKNQMSGQRCPRLSQLPIPSANSHGERPGGAPYSGTPETFWPPEQGRGGGGAGQRSLGPGYPNIHPSKRSPRRADHFEHTSVGPFGKKFTPWEGGGSQQPSWGGWRGRLGVKKIFILHTLLDSTEIVGILSRHTWSQNEILPPTICYKKFPAPFATKTWSGSSKHFCHVERAGMGRCVKGCSWAPPVQTAMPIWRCPFGEYPWGRCVWSLG